MVQKNQSQITAEEPGDASSSGSTPTGAVLSQIRQIAQKKLRKLNRAEQRADDRVGVREPPAARGEEAQGKATEQAQGLPVPAPTTKAPRVRHPEQSLALKEWWDVKGRALFGTKAELTKRIGADKVTIMDWFSGRYAPRGKYRQRLWERTQLPCFDPQALEQARQEREEKRRHGDGHHRFQPAPKLTGKQLQKARVNLNLNQAQLATVLGVGDTTVRAWERRDKPVPAILCERLQGAQGLASFLHSELSKLERKKDWRSSVRFGQRPPFETLPDPGQACGCKHVKCRLSPLKDGEWSGRGHLWVFTGTICRRRVYLNEKGENVPPPAIDRRPRGSRLAVPAPQCEQPGCPGFEKEMRKDQVYFGVILRYRCPGPPVHAAFRHLPDGEPMERFGFGLYQWRDARTGELKEIKRRVGGGQKPFIRHPAPVVECPDHPGECLRRSSHGSWRDKETRKLRWGYGPCPQDPPDHPGWTCSHGEVPRRKLTWPERRRARRRRRAPKQVRDKAKQEYKKLLPELQALRRFVDGLRNVRILPREKQRLIEEHVREQSYRMLPQLFPAICQHLEGAIINPLAWTPSELAVEILASRHGCKPAFFFRKILH